MASLFPSRAARGVRPAMLWSLFAIVCVFILLTAPANSYDYHRQQYDQQQQQQQQSGHRAVLLDDVKALTLRRGMMTSARRVSPVPQLQCVAGCEFEPDVVQCVNVGSDGVAVQWRCEGEMPADVRFGHTQVSCEGFDYPDDPRVLHGSCGLQYSLVPVQGAKGSSKRNKKHAQQQQQQSQYPYQHQSHQGQAKKEGGSLLGRLLSWAIVTYIAIVAFRSCCCGWWRRTARPAAASGTGSGYYPPPPSPPPPPPPGGFDDQWGGSKTGYSSGAAAAAPPPPVPTWASAATGFGLGYLFGQRRTTPQQQHYQQQQQQPYYRVNAAPNPWPRTSTGGSSRSDDDTHTSTAFASTSRR